MSGLSGYLTENELAVMLGMTQWGLRGWRKRGYGPTWAKIGRVILYREVDVRAFIDAQANARAEALS